MNKKIGWIGLGKMGKPMSEKLLKAGYELSVYNRTATKEEPLKQEGASTTSTPKELVEKCDIIFLMVSDDEAVREIFTSEEGILTADVSGKTIINMSTVSPDVSREMAKKLKESSGNYVDAPVSGSVKQAEEASLVVIAAGDKNVVEEVKPLLEKIGKSVIYIGETGLGNAAKLAVNTFLGVITQGLAEVAQFSAQMGIDNKDLMEIINNSALGSPFVKLKGDSILKEDYNAAFTLTHLTKDLRLAKESGLDSPLGNTAYESFKNAEAELGDEDVIAIFKKLKK
ncbi:NAD(P)-dependent oxidoreductase [Zunongwangia sp. F363]|uniref:NAD(P)-dependent oxidoreductase n=1 Tax=Autumnicola tepida TaxID=3075595 RepID=A0ABU3CDB7_9FLAO|nr:NAD(P)-dependent oxidoreductase [Zunongwangia sp. F363]MDT0644325.1 NAD(P)-dependent oxidoreductase [Zunongwangia sp. F363]